MTDNVIPLFPRQSFAVLIPGDDDTLDGARSVLARLEAGAEALNLDIDVSFYITPRHPAGAAAQIFRTDLITPTELGRRLADHDATHYLDPTTGTLAPLHLGGVE